MENIVAENRKTFKELEQEIYLVSCNAAVEITRRILEHRDQEIFEGHDRSVYKSEGYRKTSIKTVYGTVEYRRRCYRTTLEDGRIARIYLLDKELGVEKIGLISENLAEKIADAATESPYRVAADSVTEMTGNSISAQGAWDMMQRLGERVIKEEEHAVNQMNTNRSRGEKILPVLFEEMDGVWIRQQGEHHEKKPKQEVKVAVTYEGWDSGKENRSTLVGKNVIAGIEDSRTFHDKREAEIRRKYDADEIGRRVLNGDGGSWICEPNDPDAIIQLDPFHVHKEIRRCIADKEARAGIEELLDAKDIEGALSYIEIYADSVDSDEPGDKKARNARELLRYLSNNKDGLIPWQERGIELPEPPEGIAYKNMGVQENQNCTVITMRMKHRRMRWSRSGGNNMVKALYRKENKELHETISRYSGELKFADEIAEIIEVLSASKAPKKDGKGSPYVEAFRGHMPMLDAMLTESRKWFRRVSQ